MKKFLVLYLMPHAGLNEWMSKSEEERKSAEDKMKQDWNSWTDTHKEIFVETGGAGPVTKVTRGSSEDSHNDIMLYSLVEGEDKVSIAKLFETHPHLEIPDSWIEVMECKLMPSM